jgi:hypothetical protein
MLVVAANELSGYAVTADLAEAPACGAPVKAAWA